MGTRQKKTVIQGVTREAADEAFASYAKANASINKIQAEMELKCSMIREKYQSQLGALMCERECAFETLQAFATENQSELFSKKKSLEMAHGVIGFRTGTPKLKTLKGFTWASALELVKVFLPGYVRQTVEIAKDKLLADRDLEDVGVPAGEAAGTAAGVAAGGAAGVAAGTAAGEAAGGVAEAADTAAGMAMSVAMAKCGIQVVQDETFFVEPKREEVA